MVFKTLEELKAENKQLKQRQETIAYFEKEERERRALAKENRALKNPRKVKVVRVLKRTGRGLGIMGKGVLKIAKKGVEGYAHSKGTNAIWEKPKPVKRIRKARRKKNSLF